MSRCYVERRCTSTSSLLKASTYPAIFLLSLLLSGNALAARRFAILVGANTGSADEVALRFAKQDALHVRDVLVELGDFAAEDVVTLDAPSDERLFQALEAMEKRIAAQAQESLFLFYYSGHADDKELHLGSTPVALEKLQRRLRELPAAVKVGIVDACRSGSLLRKGALGSAPAFAMTVQDDLSKDVSGIIFLTSSGADELSLEGPARFGASSVFTKHLVSGLRGAADANGDQRMSLEEVFTYAYDQTVLETAATTAGPQHPAYNKELKGHGNLYLTEKQRARARLRFPRGDKRCYATSKDQRQLIAEMSMRLEEDTELALPPGEYLLKCRENTKLKVASFELNEGQTRDFNQLSFDREDPFSEGVLKGTPSEMAGILATRLMFQANQMLDRQPEELDIGMHLAVQALNLYPSPEAIQVLLRGLERLPVSRSCLSHQDPVRAAAWSPEGGRLATATSDNEVLVWDLKTQKPLIKAPHDTAIEGLSWRSDGTRLTLRDPRGGVVYLDFKPGQKEATRERDPLYAVALDPAGVNVALMDQRETLIVEKQSDGAEVLRESAMRPPARFSANGRFLAAMSITGQARVWELSTHRREELAVKLAVPTAEVSLLAISPDGRLLALAQEGGRTVQVWDMSGARQLPPLSHDGAVTALAFASTTTLVTASADKTARLWDVATGSTMLRMQHEAPVDTLSVSPDGQWLATTWSEANSAALWNLRTGLETRLSHTGTVKTMTWSPRSDQLATGSEDGTACVWGVPREEVARIPSWGLHSGMAFAQDGRFLVTAAEGEPTCLWEASSGTKVDCLEDSEGTHLVAISPDEKFIATASGSLVRVSSVSSGKEIFRMQHESFVYALEFSPDGSLLASASQDGTARVWGTATGRAQQRVKHDGPVKAVSFSGDGKRLATGGEDKTARIWDVATGNELLKLEHQPLPCAEPTGVAEEACDQPYMPGTPPAVESVRLSSDGRRLATATLDGVVRIWDTGSGKELLNDTQATRIRSMVFTPDGRGLAIANGEPVVSIWDVETGKNLPSVEAQEFISSLQYSPDGKYLLTLSNKGMVSIWDAVSRTEVSRTQEGASTSPPLLSRDGRFLATVRDPGNGRNLIYSIHWWRPEDLIKQACSRLGRSLSEEEWEKYLEKSVPYQKTCPDQR